MQPDNQPTPPVSPQTPQVPIQPAQPSAVQEPVIPPIQDVQPPTQVQPTPPPAVVQTVQPSPVIVPTPLPTPPQPSTEPVPQVASPPQPAVQQVTPEAQPQPAANIQPSTNIYSEICTEIIQEQEQIIGGLAIEQADRVQGLSIDPNTHQCTVTGDPTNVINELISQYQNFFGHAAVEVCKEAASQLLVKLPQTEIPSSLR